MSKSVIHQNHTIRWRVAAMTLLVVAISHQAWAWTANDTVSRRESGQIFDPITLGPFSVLQVMSIGVPFSYANPQRFLGTWDFQLYLTNTGSAQGIYVVEFDVGDPCCTLIDRRFTPAVTVDPGETRLFSFHWVSGPWDITQSSGPDEGTVSIYSATQPAEIEAGTSLTGIMAGWPQEWDGPF